MSKTLKCVYPFPILIATYAGGRQARFSFWQAKGKPWDWARAERVASNVRFSRDHLPASPVALAIEHDGVIHHPSDAPAKVKRGPSAKELAALIGQYLAGTVARDSLAAAIA